MVGLGIGMDHALDSKLAAPLVEHHSTQPCGEVLPSKAVMLVADIRAAHERSLSSSRLEEADASTSTKTLCAETLELGLLWQPLPGDGALRDGGPMELRIAEGSAESSFEAGNLSSDAFPFGLSDDRPDLSVVGGITTSFGGLNEHAEAPLHDLVAISASSSERSFTVYETGTHLPSRVARALTEAGLTSADERNTSLDAARAVSSVSAHDESVVFVGIHDAELFPPSQAWLGRESLCAEPLDMLSMREELDFTPAYSATLQHMQDVMAFEHRPPATSRRPRAQTVATVRPDLGATVEKQRRQRALSSPRLGRLRNLVQSVDQRDESRLTRLSRVAQSGPATSRLSSSRTSRGSFGTRPFRTTPRTNRIAQGIAATARVALVCASSSPADASRVSTESQYSHPSLYVSPVKVAAALNKPLPDTPLPMLQAVRIDAATEDARDALLAFFATNENFYAARGDSPVSDDASTVVGTPSPPRAERVVSLASVSSEQTPKALLIDTAPTTFRLPARAPTLDFHLPLRIHPASTVETAAVPESWSGVADVRTLKKAAVDDTASLLSMDEYAAYAGVDLNFESTPPRVAQPGAKVASKAASTDTSEDEAPLRRAGPTREPDEVLDEALALLRSRERFVPAARQVDRPSSPRSMTSSDSGLSNGPQLLFKTLQGEVSAVGTAHAAAAAPPADVRTWSDEEAELERERSCYSPIWMQRPILSSLRIDSELERLRSHSSPGTPTGRRSKPQSTHASQEGTPRHHRTATLQIESRSPARRSAATSSGSPKMRPLMLPTRRRAMSTATTLPASKASSPLSEVSTPKLPRAIDRTATLRLAAQAPLAPVETPTRRPLAAAQLTERSVLTDDRASRTSKRALRSPAASSARHSRSASATPRSCPISSNAPEAKACASPGPNAARPRRPPMVRARSSTVSGIPTLSQVKLLHAASSPPLLSKSVSERARLRARESDYASPTMQVFRFYDSRRSVAVEDAQPRDAPTDEE
jgi:hypothetical protein